MPFGVGSEYSCRRSGCSAGHFSVMGKSESWDMEILIQVVDAAQARKPV
jgi:hypothetical protein